MHIPDGYLSPETCAVGYLVAAPVWAVASRRVTRTVRTRSVPLLAVFAAAGFLIMMVNIPIPGGTSAHAVGAAAIAISLGPWAAVIALSVALLFEALLFGDGGVLALGVNVVNLAILMPFVAVAVYRLVAGRSPLTSRRRLAAAGVAGYVSINVAGLATGVELGLQPLLFHTASGTPLYSPYSLAQAVGAMALAHLTLAGAAEAILTAGVFRYLAVADPGLLAGHRADPVTLRRRRLSPGRVAVLAVAALAVLSPLGLLAPGEAFAESAPGGLDLSALGLSAVPAGLATYYGFWHHSLLDGYGFLDGRHPVLAYWLSAGIGLVVVGAAVYLLGCLVVRLAPAGASPR